MQKQLDSTTVMRAHIQDPLLSGRELATVLAALRYWQRRALHGPTELSGLPEYHVASDGGQHEPLAAHEIDRLCQRINLDCESDRSF